MLSMVSYVGKIHRSDIYIQSSIGALKGKQDGCTVNYGPVDLYTRTVTISPWWETMTSLLRQGGNDGLCLYRRFAKRVWETWETGWSDRNRSATRETASRCKRYSVDIKSRQWRESATERASSLSVHRVCRLRERKVKKKQERRSRDDDLISRGCTRKYLFAKTWTRLRENESEGKSERVSKRERGGEGRE